MLAPKFGTEPAKVLTFDTESRPLSYLGSDFTTSELTAIAAKWSHLPHYRVWVLGEDTQEEMMVGFREMYAKADLVSGHYIRNHDLPRINASLIECGLPELPRKLTCCTKNDLVKFSGISKSQENLCEMFGIEAPKIAMNQVKWRTANRLTPAGITLTVERVVGDITQHEALRAELVARNLLKPPRSWG